MLEIDGASGLSSCRRRCRPSCVREDNCDEVCLECFHFHLPSACHFQGQEIVHEYEFILLGILSSQVRFIYFSMNQKSIRRSLRWQL